jgi:hypothetical protein
MILPDTKLFLNRRMNCLPGETVEQAFARYDRAVWAEVSPDNQQKVAALYGIEAVLFDANLQVLSMNRGKITNPDGTDILPCCLASAVNGIVERIDR